jgi:pyroglutamyl-peptidase
MRVLIAGFGPFPGAPFNPSALLVKALARRRRPALASLNRTTHVFATAYAAVDRDLATLFAAKPDIVLMFGLAARRHHVCIETRARNAVSVLFPDACGYRPQVGVIAAEKPSWQRGNAPFSRLLHAARTSRVPVRLSRDAGRYLCNYAYWQALQRAERNGAVVAFVHVPRLRLNPARKGKKAGPSLREVARAAEAMLIGLAGRHHAITARWSF